MKEIELTQGKKAIVDDEDYAQLVEIKWYAAKSRHTFYAVANARIDGVLCKLRMHRHILSVTESKILVDHRDKNGLNNQRSNLRLATNSQNLLNAVMRTNATSKYHGVRWSKNKNKWAAQISKNGKNKHIGYFQCEIEAAKVYNKVAIEIHGEFANLNILPV